jgi:hypothetical protein
VKFILQHKHCKARSDGKSKAMITLAKCIRSTLFLFRFWQAAVAVVFSVRKSEGRSAAHILQSTE